MKTKDLKPRLFYPAKVSFRMDGQIKYFPDKAKLKYGWADKVLSRQGKAKVGHHHQAIIPWNVTGTYLRKRDQNHEHGEPRWRHR